jgi:hypothetical protein
LAAELFLAGTFPAAAWLFFAAALPAEPLIAGEARLARRPVLTAKSILYSASAIIGALVYAGVIWIAAALHPVRARRIFIAALQSFLPAFPGLQNISAAIRRLIVSKI